MNDANRAANSRSNTGSIFRALKYRNYKLFFAGQGISLIGTWIQSVALGWLVYSLTHSAVLLGVVGFSSQIATLILSPIAGVFVDRLNKHRILITTQSLFMVQALALSTLVLTHRITTWEIIVLSMFSGLVNGFDVPARQSFVVDMVENREDLGNAIALNSTMFNGARMVGPALAGLLIAAVGEGMCFLLNGISYIAVIVALWAMRLPPMPSSESKPSLIREMREGFSYVFGSPGIKYLIALLALISLVGMPYTTLMPVFATNVLRGGPATLGFLTGAIGIGALVGGSYLASRRTVLGLGRWIAMGTFVFGAGLIAFSFSRNIWLSLGILGVVGFAAIIQMAATNTILQTIVDDNMRGRVMSFYTAAFLGMAPLGSLLGGILAGRIGAPRTVELCAALAVVGAAAFSSGLPAIREHIRPIYYQRGILPEVSSGLETVCETCVPPEQE